MELSQSADLSHLRKLVPVAGSLAAIICEKSHSLLESLADLQMLTKKLPLHLFVVRAGQQSHNCLVMQKSEYKLQEFVPGVAHEP